jgi:hypothetical protein
MRRRGNSKQLYHTEIPSSFLPGDQPCSRRGAIDQRENRQFAVWRHRFPQDSTIWPVRSLQSQPPASRTLTAGWCGVVCASALDNTPAAALPERPFMINSPSARIGKIARLILKLPQAFQLAILLTRPLLRRRLMSEITNHLDATSSTQSLCSKPTSLSGRSFRTARRSRWRGEGAAPLPTTPTP